uniref:RNA helicase n=1 Tax=Arcella intermedia TaxID=1963864 RepID=A0A6B2L0B7_9EUKA
MLEKVLENRGLKKLDGESKQAEKFTEGPMANQSLLEQKMALLIDKPQTDEKSEIDKLLEEEKKLMAGLTADIPLQTVADRAQGVTYSDSLVTTWVPPAWATSRTAKENNKIRKKYNITVKGEDVPPPLESFEAMKFPRPVLTTLNKKNIVIPSPIQIQGLPIILSGRDTIGVASTGSGKTLVFALPMLLFSLEEELKMHLVQGEGPFGLILCPSRELAAQTFNVIKEHVDALESSGYPRLNLMLVTGGTKTHTQTEQMRGGVHMIVATPGRLIDMLHSGKITLHFCKFFVLDEADRLLDEGFEEDIRNIMDFFSGQRQTILFSATMPATIQSFGRSALVRPVEVNVGRAGAVSLDVLQEIEFVPQEKKITFLLECLQKTPPPVLIFCENKNDVDDIHEYLLEKGVEAVSIHGGKGQEERAMAVELFSNGKKDVLIASDVVSKGLDFPNIQHVINFDMPKEIENYIHRIGRTGRSGKTGISTTFINRQCSELLLLDLKALLIEAKQRIPLFLSQLGSHQREDHLLETRSGVKGCSFCGGLGHRIANCPKAEEKRMKQMKGVGRDFLRH